MAVSSPNQRKVFADVVSVDAWHSRFDGKSATADLHADVVFRVARLGGEKESPVRFRLGLRRAEVVVVAPPTEPVEVVKESVSRDQSVSVGHLRIGTATETSTLAEMGAHAAISADSVSAALRAAARGSSSKSHQTSFEIDSAVRTILVTQSKTPDGQYRWELTPSNGRCLEGRGWDAKEHPRLRLRDTRGGASSLPPCVRVEIRCRKEDIEISDISLKDEGVMERVRQAAGFDNRRAAAEAYIRSALTREGLSFESFDDPFGIICLADVIAEESLG